MKQLQVALYARVSSEQQAESGTIASQVAALRTRIEEDGFTLAVETTFIDEGYSGATLVRPALERLRDAIALQSIDRLYVHSPDRLARRYAYQVLLVDEFQRANVEVVFLNRELNQSPEDELLLQVQGMIAENTSGPKSWREAAAASVMQHVQVAWQSCLVRPSAITT